MKKMLNILLGCLVLSIGVLILRHSHLVTGGTVGLSLSFSYLFHMPFTLLFFIVNIPFYIFSFIQMGWKFTISTIFAVTVLSLITSVDQWLPAFSVSPLIGAIVGGVINGFGLSILFLNRASLGGSNILALFLQKKFNWNPGKINFLFDFIVVISGIYFFGFLKGLCSILSIVITSSIISFYKNRIAISNRSDKEREEHSIKSKVVMN
ncbi:YitT family protein [Bacillus sp. 03113]|uniref:YitT family protein n=1 Tax=Bacillus sp. 03113 TaxID=2578211 RepID=UPI001144D2BC|nr:YitT family protein [Bacillus sp. 03113]